MQQTKSTQKTMHTSPSPIKKMRKIRKASSRRPCNNCFCYFSSPHSSAQSHFPSFKHTLNSPVKLKILSIFVPRNWIDTNSVEIVRAQLHAKCYNQARIESVANASFVVDSAPHKLASNCTNRKIFFIVTTQILSRFPTSAPLTSESHLYYMTILHVVCALPRCAAAAAIARSFAKYF